MIIDSSHRHSNESIVPSCGSVDDLCGMPLFRIGAMGQYFPRVELAATGVVDPRSTSPTSGLARCSPDVLQSE